MKEIDGYKGYFITEDGRVFSNRRGNYLKELKKCIVKRLCKSWTL